MACNYNYLLFFICLLIVKPINIFFYCDYVTISHLIPLYYDWSTKNKRILYN